MASYQDCWSCDKDGRQRAIDWLKSLKVGDELLHPSRSVDLNHSLPNGEGFETVYIKSIHVEDKNGYVMISYREYNSNWDRKLPLKYAFAVRPIDSIKIDNDDESSSDSSSSSSSSWLPASNIIPFPPQNTKNKKNGKHTISFTKNKKRKRLSSSNKNDDFLTDSSELTPPAAINTLYNKLHGVRHRNYNDNSDHQQPRNKKIKIHENIKEYKQENKKLKEEMDELQTKLNEYKLKVQKVQNENDDLKQKMDVLQCKEEKINTLSLDELNGLKLKMKNNIKIVEKAEHELIVNKYQCIECMDKPKNVVFIDGCNHCALCDECEAKSISKVCPICNASYTNIRKMNF